MVSQRLIEVVRGVTFRGVQKRNMRGSRRVPLCGVAGGLLWEVDRVLLS